jgi:hypothetical protein
MFRNASTSAFTSGSSLFASTKQSRISLTNSTALVSGVLTLLNLQSVGGRSNVQYSTFVEPQKHGFNSSLISLSVLLMLLLAAPCDSSTTAAPDNFLVEV